MEPTPGVMIQGRKLSWDQMIPVFMISERPDIKEEDKPLTLLLLLWDLCWSDTKTLKYHDVQGLLHAVRNPGEWDQVDGLKRLRDLYVSHNLQWKEQKWQAYRTVVSIAPGMLAAVESMDDEDLEVVAFGLACTNLSVGKIIMALKDVRQQRGLPLPPAWDGKSQLLVPFMVEYAERDCPFVSQRVMDIGDEAKAIWVGKFKKALKMDEIPMKK
ncbi:MAG: hypothetical protein Q9183_003054 [Haloplaca sp. 2 TL-2023]